MIETLSSFTNLAVILGAYLMGSIPFGLLFTKWGGKGNIRQIGSGNIGATNVLRTGSKLLAFLTLFFDGLKGYVAVKLGAYFGIEFLAAIAVLVGHIFPIWLKFQGGKGVATYLGILLAFSVPLGAQAVLGWLSFLVLFGYSSLAAILTCILIVLTTWIWSYGDMFVCSAFLMGALIIFRHKDNIKRLLNKTEPKVR
jgi:glycerol-3-phosphate acyltransferase PlsY